MIGCPCPQEAPSPQCQEGNASVFNLAEGRVRAGTEGALGTGGAGGYQMSWQLPGTSLRKGLDVSLMVFFHLSFKLQIC